MSVIAAGTTTVASTIPLQSSADPYAVAVAPNGAVYTADSGTNTSSMITFAPGAPSDVAAVAGAGQSTVSWTAPTLTGGSDVTGYVVQYQVAGSSTWVTVPGTVTGTSTVVSGLTPGMQYVFQVAAVNSVGQSDWSASSPAVTIPAGTGGPELASTGPSSTQPIVWGSALIALFAGVLLLAGVRVARRRSN